ncbi:protein Shq1p [[Candida] anglica]
MITPFFTISQDDEFIFIDVKISHVRFSAQNIEMVVENELFIFSLAPYYLRVRLPFPCVDDERSHAEFDSKSECVKVKIPKENRGQFFPDLDLTSKLLARVNEPSTTEVKQNGTTKPLIQELDINNDISTGEAGPTENTIEATGEQFNWEISQTAATQDSSEPSQLTPDNNYGFNNVHSGIIGVSISNGNDINELGDPETTSSSDRIMERLIKENIKFDPEYYAADYIMQKYPSPDDDKLFSRLLEWKSPTTKKVMKWYKENKTGIMTVDFSTKEQEQMLDLPRKSYILEEQQKQELLTLLVSLLFAYHFDLRETEGDHNIESAWTIGRLTPQISFLDAAIVQGAVEQNVLKATVITSVRRALSYPLHRNYALCAKVWEDVYYSLRGGKRLIIKCLLDLREMFRFHDVYYVYCKIWLDDLCAWVISDDVNETLIRGLAHDLKKEYEGLRKSEITFEKLDDSVEREDIDMEGEDDMIALNLDEIEQMAEESYRAYQEGN